MLDVLSAGRGDGTGPADREVYAICAYGSPSESSGYGCGQINAGGSKDATGEATGKICSGIGSITGYAYGVGVGSGCVNMTGLG